MTTAPPVSPLPSISVARPAREKKAGRLRSFGLPPRIVALDIARGIAVLGMAAAHTVSLPGELRWDDPSTWVELVSGRSSILFALLAGVSIAIMTGRTRRPAGAELVAHRARLAARGLVIFAVGLVLELLGTGIAVILTFYGAVYAVAIVFIGMRVRGLVIWATALALAGPAVTAALFALALSPDGSGVSFVLGGVYSIVVWTALMLAGLALGRLDVTRKRTAAFALLAGVVLSAAGYGIGALAAGDAAGSSSSSWSSSSSSGAEDDYSVETVPGSDVDLSGAVCEDYGDGWITCYPEDEAASSGFVDEDLLEDGDESGWALYPQTLAESDLGGSALSAYFSSSPHSGGTMEILGSGGLALAIVGLLLLTGRALRYVLLPLAAIGSMPLTAYSAHVLAVWVVIGPGGWSQPPELFWWLAGGLLVGCTLWALLLGRGPLERLTARASDRLAPRQAPAASR